MEASAPFDFDSQNASSRRSSDATRALARRQGGIIPEGGGPTQRYFQPRFATHDPPAGSLLASFGDAQSSEVGEAGASRETGTADSLGGNEDTIEQRLMNASTSFGARFGQDRPGSGMAQARPMGLQYGANTPYPHRRNYDSYSSTTSSAMAPYHSGATPNDNRLGNEDESHHASREIASRISTLSTYLGRSASVPAEQSSQQTRLLTEISQLITSAICNLRFERENARRDADRVMQRAYRDNAIARADNRRLQDDLRKTLSREKFAKKDLDMACASVDNMKYEIARLEGQLSIMGEQSARMRDEAKTVEESQRVRIHELEDELKRLRTRNEQLEKAVGKKPEHKSSKKPKLIAPSAPSAPESHKSKPGAPSESTGAHDFLYDMLKKKSDEQESKMKANKANNEETDEERIARKYAHSPEMTPGSGVRRHDSNSFNPEAPPFQPPLSSANLVTVSDAGPGQGPTGGPSNWLALVSHANKTPVKARDDMQPATVVRAPTTGEEKDQQKDQKSSLTMHDVNQAIERIATLSKGYIVRCHKFGHPTKVSDKMLSRKEEPTWKYLVNLVFADNMFQAESHMVHILSIPNCRSYLIMRAIQDYLYRKIISPSVFLGFDSKLDQHLAALQERIGQYSNPDFPCNVRDRQAVLDDHAKIIDEALKDPKMAAFKDETIDRHARILASILQPLRSTDAPDKEADEGIRTLVSMSWELSTKVWTSGMLLIYAFPRCGSTYTESAMNAANLDAFTPTEQNDLKFMQTKISFVVTPSLAMRDDRDGNNNGVHGLRKAEVILAK
ncbi:hypothetical protein F5B19DRAFT_489490 [Rostrohypoxylon terebratum]|nr:hypothetical protein F5B19DRAFT_489490 [Rostrohypoxylon terebratum]